MSVMTNYSTRAAAGGALLTVLAGVGAARAQIQYATGQNVAPVYEGWMRNDDGSIDMLFGYLNRNWEEVVSIPIGQENAVEPGGPDRGQPTIFEPRRIAQPPGERREQFVFKVRLPKGWGPKQEVVWTVTAHGRTDKAIGTLDPLDEINDHVIAENRGGAIVEGNKAPTIVSLEAEPIAVKLPATTTLTAIVKDDGLPKRLPTPPVSGNAPRPGGQRLQGLRVKWVYYRGPAGATTKFSPALSPIAGTEGTAVTTVTFSQPGTYVLRAWADDGPLYSTAEVTVKVTGASAGGQSQGQ